MNLSNHNSYSSFEGGDDIRDLVRKKGPPLIPNLPRKNSKKDSNRSKSRSSSVRRESTDAPEIKRKNSHDAMHRRSIDGSSEDEPNISDTNSTTDTDNEKSSEARSGSTSMSINQLKDEYKNLNRHSHDIPRRGLLRDAIRRRSQSLMKKKQRNRSRSREPPGTRNTIVPKTEGKGLFTDRPSRSTKAKEDSDKEDKPRSRTLSKNRLRSKSRAGMRSKSRTPKLDPRSRSQSRTRKDRSRDRSHSRTPKNRSRDRSHSRTPKDRSRDRSQSRTRKEQSGNRSESRTRKERSRDRSESRTRKERSRDRSHSRTPKERSRARSKSRALSPSGNRDASIKTEKTNRISKPKKRPSIKYKRDKENDIPKGSDAPSDTSTSPPTGVNSAQPSEAVSTIHSTSMESDSIDSMAIRKVNSLDSSQRRKSNDQGWYKPTAAGTVEDSPKVTKRLMGLPPRSPTNSPKVIKRMMGLPPRSPHLNSNESFDSRNSGKKLSKRDWKAQLKSMFKTSDDEEPVKQEQEHPKTELPPRQWQTDLTNLDGDEETVGTFDRLWDKESVRKVDDETIKDSVKSLATVQDGTMKMKDQIQPVRKPSYTKELEDSLHQNFEDEVEVASLKKALEIKQADVVQVRAQLDTSIMESERERYEAQEALQELKDQITDLREALEDRDSKITSLQKQLDMAYSENNQEMYKAEVQLKDFREKVSSLGESLDQKDSEIKKLQGELERADLKLSTEMDPGLGDADQDLKEFREQIATLQDMVGEKIKVVIDMQDKLDESESENKIMLEELDQLLKEKNAAEEKAVKAVAGGDNQGDAIDRIKNLEVELENATNVANLQLEELDEQVDGLKDKLKAEREDTALKVKSRDATIDELTIKLRKYEAVPPSTSNSFGFSKILPSSSDSVASGKSGRSAKSGRASAVASAVASFALTEIAQETPTICTDDVTDIESAKQKVYEARADATSVRESLEISTKKCAELILANESITKKNEELVDTTWERDDLKGKVRDWTAQTYNWKRRAEEAESKLAKLQGDNDGENKSNSDAQGNMIAAAMDRSGGHENNGEKKTGWSLFGRSNNSSHHNSLHKADTKSSDGEPSSEAKDAQIAGLNETIAKLRSELVQMSSTHKEEVYLTKKRITQLEGENEALRVQNETLEQLSRFHADH